MPSGEIGYAVFVRAVVGDSNLTLSRGPKKEASELWAVQVNPQFLRNAVAEPSIKVAEKVMPKDSAQAWSREISFATGGLSKHIDGVVKACDGAKLPEQSKGEGKSEAAPERKTPRARPIVL